MATNIYKLFLLLLPAWLLAACINQSTPPVQTTEKTDALVHTDSFYCYIHKVYAKNGKALLDVDRIEFLTGEAGVKRARQDGGAMPDVNEKGDTTWSLPDDYYIVNPKEEIETVEVSPDATILLNPLDGDITHKLPGKISDLTTNRTSSFPYVLLLKNGKVVRIWEQFVP